MSEHVVISREQHAHSAWLPVSGYQHAAAQMAVPVAFAELSHLLGNFVLGFIKQGETFQLVALLGIEQGKNLYVHPENGRWIGDYVPAALRGRPFTLGKPQASGDGATTQDPVLCIEKQALTDLETPAAEPLFDTQGERPELTGKAAESLSFLHQRHQGLIATQQVTNALANVGLITQWPAVVNTTEGPRRLAGFYAISESALKNLDADALSHLHHQQALPVAYAQLLSTARLKGLGQRVDMFARLTAHQEMPDNLDSVLGGHDEEELTFDFDR